MRGLLSTFFAVAGLVLIFAGSVTTAANAQPATPAAAPAAVVIPPTSTSAPYGISFKRPVFAGACKACPWGVLAYVAAEAMKPMGYEVQVCWVCWGSFGPREMADKTIPISPSPNPAAEYAEEPPPAVPDISATSMSNLIAAWDGVGAYAADNKKRRNYRIIAVVQQPNFLTIAINKRSGISDLSQVRDRAQPTWIAGNDRTVLEYYGITEDGLKAHGGGFMTSDDRLKRASADIFIGGALLVNTPEQRMWYEASQLDDLQFVDLPPALIDRLLQQPDFKRGTIPLAMLRGVDRPIATVMREAHVIYVRDDAPDSFAYDVAKALDEHQDRFRMHGDPFYYDPKLVAASSVVPMHPGALKYYRDRGYIK